MLVDVKMVDVDTGKTTVAVPLADGTNDAGVQVVLEFLQAASLARIVRTTITAEYGVPTPGTPASGPYAQRRESLILDTTSTDTGRHHQILVCAPDDAIIASDDETIVPTDTTPADGIPDVIATAVDAVNTHCKDPRGAALQFSLAFRGPTRSLKS